MLTKKINDDKTSTLIAISNAMFETNVPIQIGQNVTTPIALRNNKDILLNSVAYLSDREDTIRIRKDVGVVTYTATQEQDNVVKIIIFGVPVIIIIAGIIVTVVRKRRNK